MKYLLLLITAILVYACDPKPQDCSYELTNTFINRTSNALVINVNATNWVTGKTEAYAAEVSLNGNETKSVVFNRTEKGIIISNWMYPSILPSQDTCYNLTDTSSFILFYDSAAHYGNKIIDSTSPGVCLDLPWDSTKYPIFYRNTDDDNVPNGKGIETVIIDDEFVRLFMKKDYSMLETFKDYYK